MLTTTFIQSRFVKTHFKTNVNSFEDIVSLCLIPVVIDINHLSCLCCNCASRIENSHVLSVPKSCGNALSLFPILPRSYLVAVSPLSRSIASEPLFLPSVVCVRVSFLKQWLFSILSLSSVKRFIEGVLATTCSALVNTVRYALASLMPTFLWTLSHFSMTGHNISSIRSKKMS